MSRYTTQAIRSVALVGHGHCWQARGSGSLDQRLDPHQAINQGKLGMQTQVNEGGGHANPIKSTKTTRPGLYRALLETTAALGELTQDCSSKRRTGPNERRWTGVGPKRCNASRCTAVG